MPNQPRMRTFSLKMLSRLRRRRRLSGVVSDPRILAQLEELRPKTRADCMNGIRPCPFAACKFNTFLDVTHRGGIVINHPSLSDPSQLKVDESCALDVADRGGETLEKIGDMLNISKERVRQVEAGTYATFRDHLRYEYEEE